MRRYFFAVVYSVSFLVAPGAMRQQVAAVAIPALCDVVRSPNAFKNSKITIDGVLLPSEHSLLLFSPSCAPTSSDDVRILAILPDAIFVSRNGKKLRSLLRKGHAVAIRATGVFEAGDGPYGADAFRFQFVIQNLESVAQTNISRQ
jgi:hypothetical protein